MQILHKESSMDYETTVFFTKEEMEFLTEAAEKEQIGIQTLLTNAGLMLAEVILERVIDETE
jgi:hypothetical protein